ncbi:hypothetical protein [Sphingomonas sp. GB1N7]|uniref:hypothetical protein n=1 Tax=Parasphingomonas caseinilytica TaxID=3096158 RepID=UPI002FCC7622
MLNIIMPIADDVIDTIVVHGELDSATWDKFVNRAARALDHSRAALAENERGASGRPPRSTMYAAAISLLGDAAPMRDELIRARERLAGKESPAIVWACLRSGLYRMRLRATADLENRAKTWRRLQPIVSAVRAKAGWDDGSDDPNNRYSDDLCDRVAAYVRAHHPNDHNLPKEKDTVKGFFAQFCEDFFEPEEVLDVTEDEIEMLPDFRRGYEYLHECVGALQPPYDDVYQVSLHRGDTTVSAFCLKQGIDRRKFHHIRVKAETQLKDCVTDKFRARMIAMVQ